MTPHLTLSPWPRRLLGFGALLGAAALAPAQTTPTPDSKLSANGAGVTDPTVIDLSPFEVSAQADTGYQATDTLAGSRLRTNLGDLACSVNVFTPEMISDLGAMSEFDVMRYSAAAEQERTDQTPAAQGILPLQGSFNFRIRGQTATRARNYFETNLIPDTFNTETIEEARGPNAILFGIGGAGGVYNTSTKQAMIGRDKTTLSLTIDNQDMKRATIDSNQSIGSQLAFRINAVDQHSLGWQPYTNSRNNRLAFAATYRPLKWLALKFDSESGKIEAPSTRYFLPIDGVSAWKLNGSPLVPNGVVVTTAAQKAEGINNWNATNPFVTLVGNDGVVRNFQGTAVSAPVGAFTSAGVATSTLADSTLFPAMWSTFNSGSDPYPRKANFFGTGGRVTDGQGAYNLSLEMEPFRDFFVNVASAYDALYNHIYDFVPGYVPGGSNGTPFNTIFGDPGQTFRDGSANPYAGDYYLQGRWVYRTTYTYSSRYRATTAYSFNLGKVFGHHTIAGLVSRDRTSAPARTLFYGMLGSPFAASPFANQNLIFFRQYLTSPTNLSQWAAPSYQAILNKPVSVVMNAGSAATTYQTGWIDNNPGGHTDPQEIERAGLVSMQNYFWDDKIVTTEGFRRTLNYGQTSPGNFDSTSINDVSYGVVFHATPWLSPFYNFSQNAVAPSSVQLTIPNNNLFPINKGQGYDTGLTLNLLNGRIVARLGYYKTSSLDQSKAAGVGAAVVTRNQNIVNAIVAYNATAGANPIAIPTFAQNIQGGDFDVSDVVTKGEELNITANLTDNWRLYFNATHSTSESQNLLKLTTGVMKTLLPFWQTPAAQGLITVNNITVAQEIANYQTFYANGTAGDGKSTVGHLPDELRLFTRYNFSAGWLRGVFLGGGLSYSGGPIIGYNTTTYQPYKDHAQYDGDVLAGYTMRLSPAMHHATLTFQFNAQNILHRYDIIDYTEQGDGQIVRAGFVAPPRYAFSTTLSF